MTVSIDVYIGAPLEHESERSFLYRICEDLQRANCPAIILANFHPPSFSRQIDFLVVTERCAGLIELKAFTHPVEGGINGEWTLILPDGSRKKLPVPNPYVQATQCKYALSDEIRKLSGKDPDQWQIPGNTPFYKAIEGFVCIYPEIPHGSAVIEGDFKVTILGYQDCVKILTLTGSRSPNWKKEQWLALILHCGLMKWEKDTQLQGTTVEEASTSVTDYEKRFYDFWSPRIGVSVPLTLKGESSSREYKTTDLFGIASEGKHYQLIGPSGSGKTELALHIALQSLTNCIASIFVQVKHYTGDLSQNRTASCWHLSESTSYSKHREKPEECCRLLRYAQTSI